MTLVTVPIDVRTDIGDLLVIHSALHIVKNQSVRKKNGYCLNCIAGYLGDTCNSQCENNTEKCKSKKNRKDILPSSDAFFKIPFYSILKNMSVFSFTIYFSIVSVFVLEITTNWLCNV